MNKSIKWVDFDTNLNENIAYIFAWNCFNHKNCIEIICSICEKNFDCQTNFEEKKEFPERLMINCAYSFYCQILWYWCDLILV